MPTLAQVADWIEAEPLFGERWLEREVRVVHSCDLMSDVLSFSADGSLLLTGLINQQVVRTAEVAGVRGVVFVRGKRPAPEVVAMAEEFGLPLLCTRLSMFDTGGLLFSRGMRGETLDRSEE